MPASASLRLLLVEDHEATRHVLTRLLDRAGYQVTTADSVASARETAEQAVFDLVISDVGLHGTQQTDVGPLGVQRLLDLSGQAPKAGW